MGGQHVSRNPPGIPLQARPRGGPAAARNEFEPHTTICRTSGFQDFFDPPVSNRRRALSSLFPDQYDQRPAGLLVRRMVHRMGFCHRLHNSKLPGNPAIAAYYAASSNA